MSVGARLSAVGLCVGLWGCGTNNDAPVPLSINGIDVDKVLGDYVYDAQIPFSPGESVPIEVETFDPEGDPVELWWPTAPLGWSFAPDAHSGSWEVPVDFDEEEVVLSLVLRDVAEDPASSFVDEVVLVGSSCGRVHHGALRVRYGHVG